MSTSVYLSVSYKALFCNRNRFDYDIPFIGIVSTLIIVRYSSFDIRTTNSRSASFLYWQYRIEFDYHSISVVQLNSRRSVWYSPLDWYSSFDIQYPPCGMIPSFDTQYPSFDIRHSSHKAHLPLWPGVVQHHRGEQEAQEAVHEHQTVRIRETLALPVLPLQDTLLKITSKPPAFVDSWWENSHIPQNPIKRTQKTVGLLVRYNSSAIESWQGEGTSGRQKRPLITTNPIKWKHERDVENKTLFFPIRRTLKKKISREKRSRIVWGQDKRVFFPKGRFSSRVIGACIVTTGLCGDDLMSNNNNNKDMGGWQMRTHTS